MENVTDTGISAPERLLNTWLNFQLASKTVDLETSQSARNVPDRVDVQTGSQASTAVSKINWQWVGIGVASLLGVGLLLKLAR